MSDRPIPRGRFAASDLLGALIIGAVVLGLFFFLSAGRQQALNNSPAGFAGLRTWLVANDLPAQNFNGGWPVDPAQVDLAIVPLFDTDLRQRRELPTNETELLMQQDEYDLARAQVFLKLEAVRTLLILPKWRTGMRLTGLAHPVLLSDVNDVERTLQQILGADAELLVSTEAVSQFDYQAANGDRLSAEIYAAQGFTAKNCRPIIGTADAMILAECLLGRNNPVLVLSDPDLLNNHGLRLGDNARIAADLVAENHAEGLILLDYSFSSWYQVESGEGIARDREWSDLARFFEPPFLLLWVGTGLLLGLALWRGGVRNGPALRLGKAHGASKTLAIAARARLMRRTDQDGALVGAYANARIAATAVAKLGPDHGASFATDQDFQSYLNRRHPNQAARFATVLSALRALPPRSSAAEAASHIEDLEAVLEEIKHDT